MALFRRHDGDLRVERDLKFVGVVTGTLTVCPESHFILDGTVMKNLIVQRNGTAIVRGAVLGDLVVQAGGSAIIQGEVMGTVLDEGAEVILSNGPKA